MLPTSALSGWRWLLLLRQAAFGGLCWLLLLRPVLRSYPLLLIASAALHSRRRLWTQLLLTLSLLIGACGSPADRRYVLARDSHRN